MVESHAKKTNPPSELGAGKQLADMARQFERLRTGLAPESVTVLLAEDSLMITLRGVLSPAEKKLAETPFGAAQVREFHRQLFLTSCSSLLKEIELITGVAVLEATSDVATQTDTMVLVFLLAAGVAASTWIELKNERASRRSPRGNEKPSLGNERDRDRYADKVGHHDLR